MSRPPAPAPAPAPASSRLRHVCAVGGSFWSSRGDDRPAAPVRQGSLTRKDGTGTRVRTLVPTIHNTAVLGPGIRDAPEYETRLRRLERWVAMLRRGSRLFVELDRATAFPGMMPYSCEKLHHLSEPVMRNKDLLGLLAYVSTIGRLFILFDFKHPVLVTSKRREKTATCKERWRDLLRGAGINFEERPEGLQTQKMSSCQLIGEAEDLKVYREWWSDGLISPLHSIVACGSAYLAFDAWSMARRDSLIRALHLDADGRVGETAMDYTPVEARLVADRPVQVCHMDLGGDGDPAKQIVATEGEEHLWRTLESTYVFAVKHDGEWFSGRVVSGSHVRMDVAVDPNEAPFTFRGERGHDGSFYVMVNWRGGEGGHL